ncbi:hypothetical protein B0H34DRAFT_793964 [Crassisporium funariophilum]|nr:hypothetical protein B0H34DRAFT_793964 [Crassisporium funariophilum]
MSVKTVLPLGLLLITPFNPSIFTEDSCLSTNFFGNYGDGQSTYSVVRLPETPCEATWETYLATAHYTSSPHPGHQLVWLEKKAVEAKLETSAGQLHNLDQFLDSLQGTTMLGLTEQSRQEVLSSSGEIYPQYGLHYRSAGAALVSVSPRVAKVIDTLLPPFWKSNLLPTSPVVHHPILASAIDPVNRVLSSLKFDPVIASVVNNISLPQMKNDIRFLTGEDGKSGIVSRHSFSIGALTAANWLKDRIEDTGANCRLMPFLVGFAPNVICRYSAIKDTNATVLISAHYDSRGSFGSTRAPGGDDDGSGTTGILSIARTIARKKVKFHSNVELALFAGEEQGLLGSKAYARELRAANASLTLMIQADMTAYRAPGEPLQLGLPDRIGSPEVTQLVANVSKIYSPELQVGFTAACCSDHQSFHEQGFPATQVFERAGPIADPMYHNSGDLSDREGYDFEQLFAIAKVQFATVLHTAGYEL